MPVLIPELAIAAAVICSLVGMYVVFKLLEAIGTAFQK